MQALKRIIVVCPPWLLVLTIANILFISFLPFQISGSSTNSLAVYLLGFIKTNFLPFFIIFLIILFVLFLSKKSDKKSTFLKKTFLSLSQIIITTVLGFFLSILLLFSIAVLELNILSIILDSNPRILGITSDLKVIASNITSLSTTPVIIPASRSQGSILKKVAAVSTGKDSFYAASVLSQIPDKYVKTTTNVNEDIYLLDNNLIISKLETDSLGLIGPLLSKKLIQKHFPGLPVKQDPKIEILEITDYRSYRKNEALRKLAKLDYEILKINETKIIIENSINKDKETLQQNQQFIELANAKSKDDYTSCVNSKTKKLSTCKVLKKAYDEDIKKSKENITKLSKKIINDQNRLYQYDYYQNFFVAKKAELKNQSEKIPNEFGIFTPPDSIKIALPTNKPESFTDALSTLTHEYLHFLSYQSEKEKLSFTFFEEGLTEYFTRKIIEDSLNTKTNIGYPGQVKIISELTSKIPYSELAQIYFTKDEERLNTTINNAFGDNFYENNSPIFITLQYTTDPKQSLKLSNLIMAQLNAKPLKEADLASTFSK